MAYFFDTYAIIEIIKGSENYRRFVAEDIITSILNIGELYYILLRDFDEQTAEEWQKCLEGSALQVPLETITKAMRFKLQNRGKGFSFIDCAGYTLAKENGMVFVTGDDGFRDIPGVEFIK